MMMKFSPFLLATSSLVAILSPLAAQAEEFALNFDLPVRSDPIQESISQPSLLPHNSQDITSLDQIRPLPVPPLAANPPMRYHSPQQLPKGVYRRAVAVALTEEITADILLPPAPTPLTPQPLIALGTSPNLPPANHPLTLEPKTIALTFDLVPLGSPPLLPELQSLELALNPWSNLFVGDSDSLVARAIGNAEGTRSATGGLTRAYYGHRDPGNQVWNLGTFSYQHGAASPGEADQRQLKRLQSQVQVLQKRALKHGLTLSLEETLNGLDLANQSPLAAIGRVGYVERLVEAKAKGNTGAEAIVVARTRSYINPETQRWNAPGLGNTEASIRRDQERRTRAVAQSLAAYQREHPGLDPKVAVLGPRAVAIAPPSSSPVPRVDPAIANNVLSFDLEAASAPQAHLTAALTPGQPGIPRKMEESNPTVSPGQAPAKPLPLSGPPVWSLVREAHQVPLAYQAVPPMESEAAQPSPGPEPSPLAEKPHSPTTSLSQTVGALPESVIHFPTPAAQVAPAADLVVSQLDQERPTPITGPEKSPPPLKPLGLIPPLSNLNLP